MWQRYATSFGSGVSLEHFQRQLSGKPSFPGDGHPSRQSSACLMLLQDTTPCGRPRAARQRAGQY